MTWNEFTETCPRWAEVPRFSGLTEELWNADEKSKNVNVEELKNFYAFHLFNIDLYKQKSPCGICGSEKTKPMFFMATGVRNYCYKCYEKDVFDRELEEGEPKDWFEYCREEHEAYAKKKKLENEAKKVMRDRDGYIITDIKDGKVTSEGKT